MIQFYKEQICQVSIALPMVNQILSKYVIRMILFISHMTAANAEIFILRFFFKELLHDVSLTHTHCIQDWTQLFIALNRMK